jgi:hypothetical protein
MRVVCVRPQAIKSDDERAVGIGRYRGVEQILVGQGDEALRLDFTSGGIQNPPLDVIVASMKGKDALGEIDVVAYLEGVRAVRLSPASMDGPLG